MLQRLLLVVLLSVALLGGGACQKADVPVAVTPAPVLAPEPKAPSIAGQRVDFDSLDIDTATGRPVRLHGLLFSPPDAGSRRLPAVLALHGCGGMYSVLKSKRDALSMRHQAMADLLVAEGYIVLFPDSFRSRGVEEICTIESRRRTITQRNRLSDTLGALAWLQRREDVQPDRIAVLGWSHGGSAVLAGLNTKDGKVADRKAAADYFRAGVAFYPGCSDSLHVKLRLFSRGTPHALHRRQRRLDAAGPLREPGGQAQGRGRAGGDHGLREHLPRVRRARERTAAAAAGGPQRRQPRQGRHGRVEPGRTQRRLRPAEAVPERAHRVLNRGRPPLVRELPRAEAWAANPVFGRTTLANSPEIVLSCRT